MNENIDLTKILEGCPEGTKFYSPLFGEVEFVGLDKEYSHPIITKIQTEVRNFFSKEGYYFTYEGVECLLFPSKDQRDWNKFERFWDKPKAERIKRFDPTTLQPFDKVLVRNDHNLAWACDFFSHIGIECMCTTSGSFFYAIPYNNETKHLVGTKKEAPEYYRYRRDKRYCIE